MNTLIRGGEVVTEQTAGDRIAGWRYRLPHGPWVGTVSGSRERGWRAVGYSPSDNTIRVDLDVHVTRQAAERALRVYAGDADPLCAVCGAVCQWAEDAWTCTRASCGSEWDADHSWMYVAPGEHPLFEVDRKDQP